MIADEGKIRPGSSETKSPKTRKLVPPENDEGSKGEKLPSVVPANEDSCNLSNRKDPRGNSSSGQTGTSVSDRSDDLGDHNFEEDVLGDNVAINFEPPGRYLVETEVNFMTANLSLSMRRTVRTRLSSHQRPTVDPETALALITKPCVNYKIKAREILKFIKSNPETSDLKITFYMAACDSRTALKPYPTPVVEETDIGQESLNLVNEEIPSVKLLMLILNDLNEAKTSNPVIAILHWLLILLPEPKLKHLPPETFHSIFEKVERAVNFQAPTHVFKMMFNRASSMETTWQAKKGERKSYFAFYTDSLEKMHSIIHLGFYPALMQYKGNIGPGIFFYVDLKHCLDCAAQSSGWGWGKSELGIEMRVVLVAEFLEDSDTKLFNESQEGFQEQKALTAGSDEEEDLICYYVARPDEIRIRYVLVYVQTAAKILPCIVPVRQKNLINWLGDHKASLLIGGSLALTFASKHFMQLQSLITSIKSTMMRPFLYDVDTADG
ncbi:uncharacterized protein [Halyomorpha halys]|uniref:uncharacterized protein n=1 Tax=Halyomorpha halys TaxID=286706 RepID=UPI000D0C879D|nr:uncharacterized protein LOC112211103 [Halyomorpha halys]